MKIQIVNVDCEKVAYINTIIKFSKMDLFNIEAEANRLIIFDNEVIVHIE
jgi:hypothetical protein